MKMHQELIINYGDSYILYQSTPLHLAYGVYGEHCNGSRALALFPNI